MVFWLRNKPASCRPLPAVGLGAIAVFLFGALLAGLSVRPASSADQPGRLFGYVGWDREYLYFAAKVDDRSVVGVNDRPLSEPWQDDSVELCFDMAGAGGESPHPACARLALSAAGGFTALVGTAEGTWRADPSWALGLRFDVAVQGTLNKVGDRDTGYFVEVAIPWRFLGGMPESEYEIGFNVVCHLRGEQDGFASWSPAASVPSDLDRPSTWGRLAFESQARPVAVEGARVACPRLVRGPKIDGSLSPVEWMTASIVRMDLPEAPATAPVRAAARSTQIIALYHHATTPPAAAPAQPREGLGPWWRSDSVTWHRRQAREARLAGIDTLAVAYPVQGQREQARRSLACLVQALKDLKAERYTYPLLAMYLEPGDSAAALSAEALYSALREFFLTVPPEFRAQAQGGSQRAHIVILGAPSEGAASEGLVKECTSRFQQEFGGRPVPGHPERPVRVAEGRPLLWLGEEGWKARGVEFDGYWSRAAGFNYQPGSRVSVATICPGPGAAHRGDYETNWMRLIILGADFAIINSWNNFTDGTQICASRQYGVAFVDATRRYAAQLAARSPSQVSLRRDTVPEVMAPGQDYQIELLLENNSFADLSSKQSINFEYDIESVREPKVKITRDAARSLRIPAGATMPVMAYVSTMGKNEPLQEGDYLLSFRVGRSKVPIFTSPLWQEKVGQFVFPVRVGRVPAVAGRMLTSSVPTQMQAGATYAAEVRLRNDGSSAWKRRQVKAVYRWLRSEGGTSASATDWQPATTADLPQDVKPGQMVSMAVNVSAPADAGGNWRVLEWGLSAGGPFGTPRKRGPSGSLFEGQEPVPVAGESVRIVNWDSGLRLIRLDMPRQMEAGGRYEALVTFGNVGASTWKANEVQGTCQWHFLDGTPVPGVSSAQLPVDTPPGKIAVVRLGVQAPAFGGTYLLHMGAVFPERGTAWENDGAGRASFEPVVVRVSGGPFEPVDLAEHLNAPASTTPSRRSAGDFDGAGRSLPAEQIPPDLSVAEGGWYPCGYYSGEANAPRHMPFMFPKPERGVGRCVASAGQRIKLPAGRIVRLHLIAAATQPGVAATFTVVADSGEGKPVSLPIGYWLEAPNNAEEAGFRTPYVRTATSDEPTPAYLRHYTIEASGATALELPRDARVRVVALTVEREGPAPSEAAAK